MQAAVQDEKPDAQPLVEQEIPITEPGPVQAAAQEEQQEEQPLMINQEIPVQAAAQEEKQEEQPLIHQEIPVQPLVTSQEMLAEIEKPDAPAAKKSRKRDRKRSDKEASRVSETNPI